MLYKPTSLVSKRCDNQISRPVEPQSCESCLAQCQLSRCSRTLVVKSSQLEELEALEQETREAEAEATASDADGDDAAAARKAKEKALRQRCRVVPLELQRLFSRLQILDRRSIETQDLTERGFKWTGSQGSVQHDVAELNRKLYERVEKSLVGLPGDKLVGSLYSGSSGAGMECMKCRNSRERAEPAYDVLVTVSPTLA